MVDDVTNPDQSYWDWIKRSLGIVPNGLPTYPANSASSVVTADPSSTGFIGLSTKPVGDQVRDRLGMQPLTYNNPGGDTYQVDNSDPFRGPNGQYNLSDLAYALGIPGFKSSNQIADETARANAAPDKRDYKQERAAREMANVIPASPAQAYPPGPSAMPASPAQAYSPGPSAVAASPREAYAPGTSVVPASPLQAYMPGSLAVAASPREAYTPGPSATPASPLEAYAPGASDATAGLLSGAAPALPPPISIADRPVAAVPDMPVAPSAPAPNAPMGNGAQNNPTPPQANNSGFMGNLFGAPNQDPNAINPTTGLTNAQTRMLQTNMFLNLGGNLLAAGEQMMPYQRAQILAKLGNAMPDANAISAMQTRLLENNKLARENAIHTNLVAAFRSPEIQKEISSWTPDNQVLAKAAIQAGDDETLKDLWAKNQVRALPDGSIFDPKSGTITSQFNGTTRLPGYGNTSAQSSAPDTSNLSGDELLNALPENQRGLYSQLLSGNMSVNEALSRVPFQQRAVIAANLQRIDPEANLDARRQIAMGFSKTGPNDLGTLRTAIGTSFAHGNELLKSFEDNKNSNIPLINSLSNEWSKISGYSGAPTINTAVRGFATETMRAMKGGMPNEGEVNALVGDLPANASPTQARSVIDRITTMARQRAEETEGNIKTNMGRFMRPNLSMFTPDVKSRIDDYNANPYGKPKAATAPAPGKYKWNPQTGQMEPQ
jgi:hypothetical protein